MKRRTITPQEEYTGHAPEPNRVTRVRKISAKAWIAAAISLVLSLALIGLYNFSIAGTGGSNKLALFYCEKRFFPYVSMQNSLASAGFDVAVEEISKENGSSRSDLYKIPDQYKGRQIVVVSFGKDAFRIMDAISKTDDGNIAGFCLVNPEYPGNAALEGYGRNFPRTPVAIFSSEKRVASEEKGSVSMLYEKLSGADTLYGVPAVSGTLIKSKVYITPDQNRYMSLSSVSLGNHVIRYSPVFENELARYLGITYNNGISSFRVKAWFALAPFTAFAALCFLALFVFLIPVRDSDKGEKELKGRDSLGTIIFFGLSAWIGLTICVMTFIPEVAGYARYAVVMAPAFLVAAMALMRVPFLLSRKVAYKREKLQKNAVLVPLAMSLCEIVFVAGIVLVFTDASGFEPDMLKLAAALIVFVVSSLSAFVLARADRKSRFAGEGPAAYFGNPAYFIETILPSLALLAVSVFRTNIPDLCYTSLALACGVIPYAAAVTVKRFSDFFEAAGVVYGILMGILVYVAL